MRRLHAVVRGYVQGVGFRMFVQRQAQRLNLTGYVCNQWDGSSVEVVAEGEQIALDQLLVQLQRGPRAARVEHVETTWEPATGEFRFFNIRE